jgi:hypothetical protein
MLVTLNAFASDHYPRHVIRTPSAATIHSLQTRSNWSLEDRSCCPDLTLCYGISGACEPTADIRGGVA